MNSRSEHPLGFVSQFLEHQPCIHSIELSIYRYAPQEIEDQRRIVRLPAKSLVQEFDSLLCQLQPNEDIAFHSRVYVNAGNYERVMHMPLIDFQGDLSKESLVNVASLAMEVGCNRIALYESGRSFHLYGFSLMEPPLWSRFMARLLLLNPPRGPGYIDNRWVGHRLLAGFASLRWSCNGSSYLRWPHLVSAIALNDHIEQWPTHATQWMTQDQIYDHGISRSK